MKIKQKNTNISVVIQFSQGAEHGAPTGDVCLSSRPLEG